MNIDNIIGGDIIEAMKSLYEDDNKESTVIPTTVVIEDVTAVKSSENSHGDNIAEDETSEEDLNQFIKDIENAPSVADIYKSHLESQNNVSSLGWSKNIHNVQQYSSYNNRIIDIHKSYYNLSGKYCDDIDAEYIPPNNVVDNPAGNNSRAGKIKSYHPSAEGYNKYEGIGRARTGKTKSSSRDWFESEYIDDIDSENYLDAAIDEMSDCLNNVHDCVKSTDQLMNDLYERHINTNDSIDELVEISRSEMLRSAETNARVDSISRIQRMVQNDLLMLKEQVIALSSLVGQIHENVLKLHRGG